VSHKASVFIFCTKNKLLKLFQGLFVDVIDLKVRKSFLKGFPFLLGRVPRDVPCKMSQTELMVCLRKKLQDGFLKS
jgi:hypothetical protein